MNFFLYFAAIYTTAVCQTALVPVFCPAWFQPDLLLAASLAWLFGRRGTTHWIAACLAAAVADLAAGFSPGPALACVIAAGMARDACPAAWQRSTGTRLCVWIPATTACTLVATLLADRLRADASDFTRLSLAGAAQATFSTTAAAIVLVWLPSLIGNYQRRIGRQPWNAKKLAGAGM